MHTLQPMIVLKKHYCEYLRPFHDKYFKTYEKLTYHNLHTSDVNFLLLLQKAHYRTLTKTRRYIVDGQEVTSSVSKIVMTGEENRNREEFEFR